MSATTDLLNQALEWIQMQGMWAPILFIIGFVIATAALLPASILAIGAGALFGFGKAVLLTSIASTFAAALSFLISRYLLRNWVEKKLATRPRFKAIDQAIAHEGWKMVALLRMTPIFPFWAQNYGLGLTGIGFWPAVFGSWLGLLPAVFLLAYIGSIVQIASSPTSTLEKIAYTGGLVVAILVVIRITKIASKAVRNQIESSQEPTSIHPHTDRPKL